MVRIIMSLMTLLLCFATWPQNKPPARTPEGAYTAQKATCQTQYSTGGRLQLVAAEGGTVRKMTLREPSDISIYQITGTRAQFMNFYNRTIKNWLKDQELKCQYPYEIYLMGNYLVVVSSTTDPSPWESIPSISQHVAQVEVKRLNKPGD